MRKVFLDSLPRQNGCEGRRIDWFKSKGHYLNAIYDDILLKIKIINYISDKQKVDILCNGKRYYIQTQSLLNCNLKNIILDYTTKKYNIGEYINYTNIKIIDIYLKKDKNNREWEYLLLECQDCHLKYEIRKHNLNNRGTSCKMCGDHISYGEKIMLNTLKQIGLDFQMQLSKATFKWCGNKRYDFYFEFNNEKYIIETHGEQHYKDAWDKLEVTKANDRLKKELALSNGLKEENYIVIDCRKSELEFIKQSILNSKLNELFDLSKIDWLKAEKFAKNSSLRLKVCKIKYNNPKMTTYQIHNILKRNIHSIIDDLKFGDKYGLCNYNINDNHGSKKEEMLIICLEKKLLFKSITECVKKGIELFGCKLYSSNISRVCQGKRIHTNGYHFKYIKNLTAEEYIKYDIENKLKELHNKELVQAS